MNRSRSHALALTFAMGSLALALPPRCWPQENAPRTARQQEIEELMGKNSPLDDDWETEILYKHADHELKELAGILAQRGDGSALSDVSRFFADSSALAPLRPEGGEVRTVGKFSIRRCGAAEAPEEATATDPAAVFARLLAPFEGAAQVSVAFKLYRVERHAPGRFNTTVLYQAFGAASERRVQQTARWRIEWKETDDPDRPLIAGIDLVHFDEIESRGPQFTECTGAVFADDALFADLMLRGGDYWFGRSDALGEWNYLGHNGLAVGDVNGDGLDDLYVATGTGIPNRLYVQNPDGTTTERALEAGVAWLDDTKGVLLLDHDNDGDQDLVCAMGSLIVISANDGTGTFAPAHMLRAATPPNFYSLAAADYDLDGDLDIYACRYVKTRYGESLPDPFHDARNGPPNHLLRNDLPAGFMDVTAEVGLDANNDRFSLAASWADYDADGDPDLYVANDFGRNNLYRNDGGKFVDVAAAAQAEDQAAGMGVSWEDFDLDGDFDLLVSNMFSGAGQRIAYQPRFKAGAEAERQEIQRHSLGNTLLRNNGDGTFADVSDDAGIRMGRWAFGAVFADFGNDGWPDMVVPNGFLTNELKDDL